MKNHSGTQEFEGASLMPASFRRQDYSSANHHVQYGAEQASRRVAARASGIVNESTRVF